MSGNSMKFYLVKLVKSLSIALPLNLIAGLIYCFAAKKLSIASYSEVLLFIGGGYAIIGGIGCFIGMTPFESKYTMNFSRSHTQKNIDDIKHSNLNIMLFIIGIITILISYLLVKFW